MRIAIYHIDAFTSRVFSGNPAAVCPLQEWLSDDVMQSISRENNLSETAFFVPKDGRYHIRWFSPTTEVDLCGHATLASAYVIFNCLGAPVSEIEFESKGGILRVTRQDGLLSLDFPSRVPVPCQPPSELVAALGKRPLETWRAEDYLVLFETPGDIVQLKPNMDLLRKLDLRGVIVTARGTDVDFVSRFFAPKIGVDEDPVTGSSHCSLTPYWSKKLGKTHLHAHQLSQRGGELFCTDRGERVTISGLAARYLEGFIEI